MKARFSYLLAFLLPSAMLASIAAVISAGLGAGIAWLFVYGDNSWPDAAEKIIMAFAVVVGLTFLAALLSASYAYGKSQESLAGLNKWHVAVAVAFSVFLPALVLLRQYQIGALGS